MNARHEYSSPFSYLQQGTNWGQLNIRPEPYLVLYLSGPGIPSLSSAPPHHNSYVFRAYLASVFRVTTGSVGGIKKGQPLLRQTSYPGTIIFAQFYFFILSF